MVKKLFCLALVLILVSLACGLPFSADPPTASPSPIAISQLLVTTDPHSTATPTPFQPVKPTLTAGLPEITPTLGPSDTPDPELAGAPSLPTPIKVTQNSTEGMVNLLVIGNDYRPSSGYRTDVIMFVTINKTKGTVSVISFPRDLYVTIPGWMTQRINTAFPHGGFNALADTLQYNFGIRPQYYIMTNFQGFVGIIDSLNGISVNAGASLSDKCDLPQARNGYCSVNPGLVIMDGQTALWYVRSRHTTNDFDRTRRAQEVLYAVFTRLMKFNAVSRLPEFYQQYKSSVETNMTIEDIAPLLPVASQVIGDSSRVHRYAVTPAMTTNFITSGGAMVLLPNYEAITGMINQAIFGQ